MELHDIVREFLMESSENLDQLDLDLVALESEPGSRPLLASVFRTIHTIKGTSGFLPFRSCSTPAGEVTPRAPATRIRRAPVGLGQDLPRC